MLCLSLWKSDVPQVDTLVCVALAAASAVTFALASALQLVAGADLLVHNTGGLSLTAALVTGVPSLTFAPVYGHKRATARTLDRAGTVS